MRSKAIIITIITLVVVAAAAVSAWRIIPVEAAVAAQNHHADEEAGGHARGDGHDEHGEEDSVRLSEAEIVEFGIETETAGPGRLNVYVSLPGEVVPNADRLAHIVPRVSGIVREVRSSLGDEVRAGDVMAVLESRELADMKGAYLAAKERILLAEADFKREEKLWKRKISAEKEYLRAKQALAEAGIELRSAEQKLHALGLTDEYLSRMPEHPDVSFTRYEVTAPFDGTVVEKHIALGEALKDEAEAFVVADLSTVWVDLGVYQKDLPLLRRGQKVVISAGYGIPDADGMISYVAPVVSEETRTALARVVLPNKGGMWRPGIFVTGKIAVSGLKVDIVVPKTALQTIDDRLSVFIESDEGFRPQPITTGRTNGTHVEITSGLMPGQRYVTKGAFTLKAQLSKGAFGDGHGH